MELVERQRELKEIFPKDYDAKILPFVERVRKEMKISGIKPLPAAIALAKDLAKERRNPVEISLQLVSGIEVDE
jgi:hypothetical protein